MDLVKLIVLFFGLLLAGIIALAVFRTVTRKNRRDSRDADAEARRVQALMNKSAAKNTHHVSGDIPTAVPATPAPSAPVTDVRGVDKNGIYYNSILGMKLDFRHDFNNWSLLTGEQLYQYQATARNDRQNSELTRKYEGEDDGFCCLIAGTRDNRCNLLINATELEPELAAQLTQEDLYSKESQIALADGLKASGATGVTVCPGTRMLNGRNVPVIIARGNTPRGPVCQVTHCMVRGDYQMNLVVSSWNGDASQEVFSLCAPL